MGHSYVTFGERSVQMHDIEILLTVFWIVRHAEAQKVDHPVVGAWSGLLDVYGPGGLDLGLDSHLATAEARARFRELAARARAALEAEGDVIPAARLDALVAAPALFEFGDRPKARMLADFDRLMSVLAKA